LAPARTGNVKAYFDSLCDLVCINFKIFAFVI
jgi:hypothetical protein